jgi:hypothetical protein
MPTHNPRLTVTLKPSTYAQIKEVSRLTGSSLSALIAEILEGSEPVFDRLIQVLLAAQQAKQQVRSKVVSDMEEAQGRIENQLGLALETLDGFTGDLLNGAETVKRRARRAAPGDAQAAQDAARRERRTPLSNRGVRSTANPAKTTRKGS